MPLAQSELGFEGHCRLVIRPLLPAKNKLLALGMLILREFQMANLVT